MDSPIIRKCTVDGTEHPADYDGNCKACLGPLSYYCKQHNQWLMDKTCRQCAPAPAPAATPPPSAAFNLAKPPEIGSSIARDVLAVLAVIIVLGAVFFIGWYFLQRNRAKSKTPTPVASVTPPIPAAPSPKPPPEFVPKPAPIPPPVPTAPVAPSTPAPQPPHIEVPPTPITLATLFDDPEPYIGKPLLISGDAILLDTTKKNFDLREGDHTLEIRFSSPPLPINGRQVRITGTLGRDDRFNSYYLNATRIELP